MRATTPQQDFIRGIWKENPVLIQLLGLCPALAVTNTVLNSLAMSGATLFVLLGSSLFISTLKKLIPHEVRISTYILIIATFVTIVDMTLKAMAPAVYREIGNFIPLIVVNCMILGRAEAYASKHKPLKTLVNGLGMGAGFTFALLCLGAVREILGAGALFGFDLFGPQFQPWVVMVLPPGGFLVLGGWLLLFDWLKQRQAQKLAADSGGQSHAA